MHIYIELTIPNATNAKTFSVQSTQDGRPAARQPPWAALQSAIIWQPERAQQLCIQVRRAARTKCHCYTCTCDDGVDFITWAEIKYV
jgi:hypothetical protein